MRLYILFVLLALVVVVSNLDSSFFTMVMQKYNNLSDIIEKDMFCLHMRKGNDNAMLDFSNTFYNQRLNQ